MRIVVDIGPETEQWLRAEAERLGLEPQDYVLRALEETRPAAIPRAAALSEREAELLQEINQGLKPEAWQRYRDLTQQLRAGRLSQQEHEELISISDEVEMWNAKRIKLLIELAGLWKKPLIMVMNDLGISAPPYD
jgi:hypothetical protein